MKRLTIKGDSQLIVNFSNKAYKPKYEHMEAYLEEVRKIEKQFLGLELQHMPRGTNKEADDITKRASRRLPQEPGIFEERLYKPSAYPPAAGPALPHPATNLGSPRLRADLRSTPGPSARASEGVLDRRILGVPASGNPAGEGRRR